VLDLHVFSPDRPSFTRSVRGCTLLIGRSSTCDLSLPDRSMSRRHARVYSDGEDWYIEDLGSRNGTLVDGVPIDRPQPLEPSSVVTVGDTVIRFRAEQEQDDSPEDDLDGHTLFRPATEMLRSTSGVIDTTAPADADSLQRSVERLGILNEVHQALDRSIDLDQLLELILDRAFDYLKPDEGSVFLRKPDGEYYCAAGRSLRSTGDRHLYSRALVHQVADKGQAALVLDAAVDDRFNEAKSLVTAGVRSLVAAPLLDPDGSLGMIVLGSLLHVRQFVEEDMELLTSLASVAAMRIRNVRLAEEAEERRRLEREVALARRIQVALLPDALPDVPGYELYARNLPSRGVSGDFYKVVLREPGGQCVVQIADVSGKGMGAALLTGSLEALSAGLIDAGMAPDKVSFQVSRLLYQRTPSERYATMFLAVLEPETGKLTFVNAGHNPGLLLRADGEGEWLGSTGMPIGLLPVGTYTAEKVTLEPGDTMVLYTDGITEAEDPDLELYGEDRLRETCTRLRCEALDRLAAGVEEDVEAFIRGVPCADDRTMVLVRRKAVVGLQG
jgi:serine phosphatase RsbU (regulator of sigma subunit)